MSVPSGVVMAMRLPRFRSCCQQIRPVLESGSRQHRPTPSTIPRSTSWLSRLANAAGSSGNSPSRICACSSSRNDRSAGRILVAGDRRHQRMAQVDLEDRLGGRRLVLHRQQAFQLAVRAVAAGDQAGRARRQPLRGAHVGDALAERVLDHGDRRGLVGVRACPSCPRPCRPAAGSGRNRYRPGSATSAACRRNRAAPRSRTRRPDRSAAAPRCRGRWPIPASGFDFSRSMLSPIRIIDLGLVRLESPRHIA